MPTVDELLDRAEIGGRTAQITSGGAVECATYDVRPLPAGRVRVRTVRSAISPGTEMTFYGKDASNVYLHKRWDPELRLFVQGRPSMEYPITFGYRACGEVVESADDRVPVGTRVFGNWRHTESTSLTVEDAARQVLPDGLSWEDGVDPGQMGPICLNAVLFAFGEHAGWPAVVFGAGPIGLITAQIARATGASEVHVVDRLGSRLAIARDLGFRTVDGSAEEDVALTLKRELGAQSVAVAFECTGSTFALNEAIRVVRRRGAVVALGFYQGEGRGLTLGDEFHHNGVQIRCGQIGNIHPDWTMGELRRRVLELASEGSLSLGALPRLTLPIEQVAAGFEALRRPEEVLQVELSYEAAG
jgi:threonine dehydrogenase-like Zn-dependent dehydrogenase